MTEIAEPPCLLTARRLHDAIIARTLGEQVQSVGHRGRQVAYAEMSLKDMIVMYRQVWAACPAARLELPDLQPLDQPVVTRGRPAHFVGKGYV